jgi:hypothetical protein
MYYPEFGCSPEQYHAAIDKIWEALGVDGPQETDCFSMAASEIVRMRSKIQELDRALYSAKRYFEHCERVSISGRGKGCDSAEMEVRMSLKQEAYDSVYGVCKE